MNVNASSPAKLLIGVLLVGCVHAGKEVSPPAREAAAMRAIIYFSQLPAADDKQLVAAISQACRCQPAFFRQFSNNAMIYDISLTPSLDFAIFEKSLLEGGKPLGIQAVEQDLPMQHQQ